MEKPTFSPLNEPELQAKYIIQSNLPAKISPIQFSLHKHNLVAHLTISYANISIMMTNFFQVRRHLSWVALGLILLFSLAMRLWLVNGHVSFNYDQARDAFIAQDIMQGDLKIMGPSASGTQDTIYHGVLFYYIIAILYSLSAGDPQGVAFALAAISSLGLIPIFLFGRDFFRSHKLALTLTFLTAFSLMNISYGGWISEHMLMEIFLPWYLYFCYRLYQRYSLKNLLVSALFWGLLEQSAVFNLHWGWPLFLIILLTIYHRQVKLTRLILHIFAAIAVFCLTISTMIVTQILMIKRGILSIEVFRSLTNDTPNILEQIASVKHHFTSKINTMLIPQSPEIVTTVLFLILLICLIYLSIKQSSQSSSKYSFFFPLFFFTSPFLFIFLKPNSSQIWVGFDTIVYLVTLAALQKIYQVIPASTRRKLLLLIPIVLIFFAFSQYQILIKQKNAKHDFWRLPVQIGFNLSDQIALIDYTYQKSTSELFSFDSLTDPYIINVTWSYLYSWHGQRTYGYTPVFTGPSQDGYWHQQVLSEDKKPLAPHSPHFVIIEPESTVDDSILEQFHDRQTPYGTVSNTLNFATLKLQEFTP